MASGPEPRARIGSLSDAEEWLRRNRDTPAVSAAAKTLPALLPLPGTAGSCETRENAQHAASVLHVPQKARGVKKGAGALRRELPAAFINQVQLMAALLRSRCAAAASARGAHTSPTKQPGRAKTATERFAEGAAAGSGAVGGEREAEKKATPRTPRSSSAADGIPNSPPTQRALRKANAVSHLKRRAEKASDEQERARNKSAERIRKQRKKETETQTAARRKADKASHKARFDREALDEDKEREALEEDDERAANAHWDPGRVSHLAQDSALSLEEWVAQTAADAAEQAAEQAAEAPRFCVQG